MPQGPLLALATSLKWFKWKLVQPHILQNDSGQLLDLTIGSPYMLRGYLIEAFDRITYLELSAMLAKRNAHVPGSGWNWAAIRKLLLRRTVAPNIKASALQLLYGTTPTFEWLWAHGWQVAKSCSCEEAAHSVSYTHLTLPTKRIV